MLCNSRDSHGQKQAGIPPAPMCPQINKGRLKPYPYERSAPPTWLVSRTEPAQAHRQGFAFVYAVLFTLIPMIGLAYLVPK